MAREGEARLRVVRERLERETKVGSVGLVAKVRA